jgi:hypothetical protein
MQKQSDVTNSHCSSRFERAHLYGLLITTLSPDTGTKLASGCFGGLKRPEPTSMKSLDMPGINSAVQGVGGRPAGR